MLLCFQLSGSGGLGLAGAAESRGQDEFFPECIPWGGSYMTTSRAGAGPEASRRQGRVREGDPEPTKREESHSRD